MDINKQFIYYFYFDTFELLEVYKLHFACINSYNDIFDKYTIIIGVDDTNNNELIEHWKNIIKENIKTTKQIDFYIEQNSKNYRDGIICYKYIISKLNEFDGLVCWGHSKRDLQWNKNFIYKWICCMHYFNSLNINNIENTLLSYNNKYCAHGPLLSVCTGSFNKLEYMGGMYWLYPKKILHLYKDEYNEMISYIETTKYELENNNDIQVQDNINIINLFGENWFYYFMNKHNMHSYQTNFIYLITYIGKKDVYTTWDPYINSIDEINDIYKAYNDNIYNDMLEYYNKIMNNINSGSSKESTD